MNKRTRACQITPKVKREVERRDGGLCIFCHRPGLPEAHVISRAHGGLGVAENIVTVCRRCHDLMDNSSEREERVQAAERYLSGIYAGWSREKYVYKKGF